MSPSMRVGVALAALLAAGTHAKDCRHTDVTLPPKVASIRPECRTLELRVRETDSSFEIPPGEVGYFRKIFGPDGIADQGAVALAKLLRETRGNGPPVTSLTLVGMSDGASMGYTPGIDVDIMDDGATALANLLPEVPIAHLDLSHNAVGLKGVLELANALRDPRCRLTSLYLSKNLVDDRGVTALAEAIAESPTNRLEKLNLKDSSITDVGAMALAMALKSPHCKLKLLHLQRCHITDVGAQALLDALSMPGSTVTQCFIGMQADGGLSRAISNGIREVVDARRKAEVQAQQQASVPSASGNERHSEL